MHECNGAQLEDAPCVRTRVHACPLNTTGTRTSSASGGRVCIRAGSRATAACGRTQEQTEAAEAAAWQQPSVREDSGRRHEQQISARWARTTECLGAALSAALGMQRTYGNNRHSGRVPFM